MQSLGYLTEAEYKQAMAQPIVMKSAEGRPPAATPSTANTWPSWRASCCSTYQDNVYSRGLNIYTTVQSKDQEAAARAREGAGIHPPRALPPVRKSSSTCPPAPETNPQALDDFLDGVFDKFSDSGDLLTALVLSASPQVKLARSSREIITITDKKVGRGGARALNDNKPEQRIKRGSVVYIRKFGDN